MSPSIGMAAVANERSAFALLMQFGKDEVIEMVRVQVEAFDA